MAVLRIHLQGVAVALCLAGLTLAQPPEIKSPLSPEDSLKHFQLDPLLSIELVAAEPQVVDPVAIRFDEDGRLWVAEMRDYPLGPLKKTDGKRTEKDAEPLSQIKILEDKDGDGRFETATVFADKLLFVTGLQPWKGGVIVTLSGKVAYMKDTDGDGKADVNETWFTGFSESNSQLRANHPTFALDNHIYIANGLRGGMVVNHLKKLLASGGRKPPDTKEKGTGDKGQETDDAPINISGMDFRFDPLTGEAEAVSGNGQFGLCFDDWGNRFVCSNRNPCQHVVIENRYLKKAPTVAIPSVVQDVAAFAENSRIYPISKFWTTSNLHEGQFTAACGVFIYRGDLLPQQFLGNVFTCDPTGNLIHREIMEPKGATFTSKPAYEGKEFLASPDTWFRPVGMELGPDGALYVVDMYRAVIEHPEWVPDELKNRPDERLGDDRGRIYRIVPKQRRQREKPPLRVSQMKTEELTALLANNNAWQRETAQRLIVEGRNLTVAEHISQQVFIRLSNHFDDSQSPYERLHILWTLAGKRLLKSHWINAATDRDPRVGRNVLIALETRIVLDATNISNLQLMYALEKHPLQCFQLPLSMRFYGIPSEGAVSNSIAGQGLTFANDPWTRLATLIYADSNITECLRNLISWLNLRKKLLSEGHEQLLMEWAIHLGVIKGDAEAIEIVKHLSTNSNSSAGPRIEMAVLGGLGKGLSRRRTSLSSIASLSDDSQFKTNLKSLQERFTLITDNDTARTADRLGAMRALAYFPESNAMLLKIGSSRQDEVLRQTAITALAAFEGSKDWEHLLHLFSEQSFTIRHAILDGVLQRPERIALLLDSLESGSIKPTELDPVQTGRLLQHGDAKIRQRAEKIFGSATPEDRKKALADYQSVLTMTGDAKRGQVSFAKNCATCHKVGETGVNVAPDISDSRTKTPAQILADIIQPNRAIDANYVAYTLLLMDGTTASGILTSETSTSITLKAAGAKVITVARGEIEQLKSTGVSLMPDGLEKNIPPQEMADVIAFIKNWRYLDGRVPVRGN